MPMSPRLLRPRTGGARFPRATAATAGGLTLLPINYTLNGVDYSAFQFTTSGTLTFSAGGPVEYLIVAGGGGGGGIGAGGGAGGLLTNVGGTAVTLSGAVSVTVGSGGAGGATQTTAGTNGGDSVLGAITATGGGGGGGRYAAAKNGGSGGGGSGLTAGTTGGSGVSGQGFAGGTSGTNSSAGGGGGAGAVGGNASGDNGGNGGIGVQSSILGVSRYFAGGGGGYRSFSNASATTGTGGLGGGGSNGPATAFTGGGGAGSNFAGEQGYSGGSGIVVVRYRRSGGTSLDNDAANYIARVEAADGQSLESGVRDAISEFVAGCKADGIWTAIKASCILMGARTLSGALTPLVGTAPTNNNFVSGDYNRKTGLKGNGTTKSINSGRASNADPQNSHHLALYQSERVLTSVGSLMGSGQINDAGVTQIVQPFANDAYVFAQSRMAASSYLDAPSGNAVGFIGMVRTSSTAVAYRSSAGAVSASRTSTTPLSANTFVFATATSAGAAALPYAGRIAFYSIGESLTLATLDSRASALYTAIGAAIP
jgi:hypothetical protein